MYTGVQYSYYYPLKWDVPLAWRVAIRWEVLIGRGHSPPNLWQKIELLQMWIFLEQPGPQQGISTGMKNKSNHNSGSTFSSTLNHAHKQGQQAWINNAATILFLGKRSPTFLGLSVLQGALLINGLFLFLLPPPS